MTSSTISHQLHQFNLVNYSSELLHEINKFIKSKLLVLQGVQILLPTILHQPQNLCTHFFVYHIYVCNFAKYNFTS